MVERICHKSDIKINIYSNALIKTTNATRRRDTYALIVCAQDKNYNTILKEIKEVQLTLLIAR